MGSVKKASGSIIKRKVMNNTRLFSDCYRGPSFTAHHSINKETPNGKTLSTISPGVLACQLNTTVPQKPTKIVIIRILPGTDYPSRIMINTGPKALPSPAQANDTREKIASGAYKAITRATEQLST